MRENIGSVFPVDGGSAGSVGGQGVLCQGVSGSARVSSRSWHQVTAALTARCACRGWSPTGGRVSSVG